MVLRLVSLHLVQRALVWLALCRVSIRTARWGRWGLARALLRFAALEVLAQGGGLTLKPIRAWRWGGRLWRCIGHGGPS